MAYVRALIYYLLFHTLCAASISLNTHPRALLNVPHQIALFLPVSLGLIEIKIHIVVVFHSTAIYY